MYASAHDKSTEPPRQRAEFLPRAGVGALDGGGALVPALADLLEAETLEPVEADDLGVLHYRVCPKMGQIVGLMNI